MLQYEQLFENAYNLFSTGNYRESISMLEEIKSLEEQLGNYTVEDYYILKGSAFLALNELDKSRSAFEQALMENNKSVEACLGLGKVLYSSDMKKEAKVMFEWAVKNDPDNEHAVETLKNINNILGFPEGHFIEDSELTEEEMNVNLNELFIEAYELMMNSSYDESLETVKELENLFYEEVNILKGNTYLAQDKYDKAKECFESALKINSRCVPAYNGLAELYASKNMLRDAKAMFEFALSINPEDQFAGMGLAEVNYDLGLPTLQSTYTFLTDGKLNKVLDEKLNKAYELSQEKKFEESLNLVIEVEAVIKNSKEFNYKELSSGLNNFMGFNYLGMEEYDKAKEAFEKSLQTNSTSSQACAGLGEIFYFQQLDKEAKIMFEWAVKNNPKNYFAILGLIKMNEILGYSPDHNSLYLGLPAEVEKEFSSLITSAYDLFETKNFNETLSKIDKAEKLLVENLDEIKIQKALTSLYNLRGFAYLSLNNIAKAKEAYEKALNINPSSSQACAGLGEVLFLSNKDEEAKRMFEYAVSHEPLNQFAISGLKKVNQGLGLPENDNTLLARPQKEKTEEIGNLIEEAYSLFETKNFNEAIKKLDAAEKVIEDNFNREENFESLTRLNNFKGFSFLNLEKMSEAKNCFERALNLDSKSSQACAGLAEIFLLEGKSQEAKTMFEWALKNNPNNVYAEKGLEKVNKNFI
ncbi:MAG: tetratricopeptide repeat protein [Bacteroidetes bacterium]|nr:tetratricopeptide repeat protein [Bacteroidota bacterium]